MENYAKVLNIEAQTMIIMASRQIIPAVETYLGQLAETAANKQNVCGNEAIVLEKELITRLSALNAQTFRAVEALRQADREASPQGMRMP